MNPIAGPEHTARAFCGALDRGDWVAAAELVHPETADRFRAWYIERLRARAGVVPIAAPSGTSFVAPWEIVGIQDLATAESVGAKELVAQLAAGLSPGAFVRRLQATNEGSAFAGMPTMRIVRTLIACTPANDEHATATYRADWYADDHRNPAIGGEAALLLVKGADRWYVADADLGGHGIGHILPPD